MFEFLIFEAVLLAVNAILVVSTIITLLLLKRFGERIPAITRDPNYLPTVSIVIPTMNEELLIEERLKNIISMDYPSSKLEVIFIDNSSDGTAGIIEKYRNEHPNIRIERQERHGFNNALNQGYGLATGEVVIKSDCDAFPMSDALRKIVANFADKKIGAVSAVCYFDPTDMRMESVFRNIQTKFKLAESCLHSALIFNGGFGAYRKHLIPKLPEHVTADDSVLVINVVRNGYRAIVDPSVKVKFVSPENFSERRSQLDRRAGGVIQVLLKNIRMLFNPRFGKFGLVTMPMEFFILIAAPLLVLLDLFMILAFAAMLHIYVAIGLFAAIGLFLASTRFSVLSRTLFDTYISCLHGILLASTKEKTWEKEQEGRQELLKTAGKS